jgi:lipopolysaccharide export system protein LptC
MTRLHYLTILLLVILLAIASSWIFESIEQSPILTNEQKRHDPDYFLHNFTATSMDTKGMPAYKVKARHLEHYPDDDSMKLQYPFFSFYENNINTWNAESEEALVVENGKKIHLSGNVILNQRQNSSKDSPPIKLTAEQLTIEPKRDIAHTKSKIELRQGENTINSVGMRADLKKNRIEFLSNTRSHYVSPKK